MLDEQIDAIQKQLSFMEDRLLIYIGFFTSIPAVHNVGLSLITTYIVMGIFQDF